MERAELVRKVAAASDKLETAELELDAALEKLKVIIHGDNVMVTNAILTAFERVKDSKRDLLELKQLLTQAEEEETRGQ